MQDYRKLTVWGKAHKLCLSVYMMTTKFPSEERFGLVSQMRRSAASIPTNIAEGSGRRTSADFARFIDIAIGSCSELEYQTLLSKDLDYIPEDVSQPLFEVIAEIRKMLVGLLDKIRPE